MIYICIPTHDEQQTVGVVLWKLRQVLTDFPRDYQLLVADDASTDKTSEVLEPYTRVLPLTVIRSEKRQGAAASLEMLLREAVRRSEYPKRDVIVSLQADFSEEPDDLVPLVKRLEAGADVAVGNKVSASKDTRTRRFARSLARFFMRRQKWPEGLVTPFEGYRAYRLYAVKRALEDRNGARLIRHDGWAGHAELLQAVLPHARRVDVVDIDDRPDRLQRPRREKPFAAAMQVRAMVSGAEPPGLVGVEELDRIANTASRSRERAAITARSLQTSREASGTRTNGSRSRAPGTRRDQSRSRSATNGAGADVTTEAGESRRPRSRKAQPAEGQVRKKGEEGRGRRTRPGQSEGRKRQPRAEQASAAATDEVVQPVDAAAQSVPADGAAIRPKRKRRRRKRTGGQTGAANTASQQDGDATQIDAIPSSETQPDAAPRDESQANAAGADAAQANAEQDEAARRRSAQPTSALEPSTATEAAADSSEVEGQAAADGTGEKKRRRRGGRRGGRGRRKPRPEGAAEGGTEAGSQVELAETPAAAPVARVEND